MYDGTGTSLLTTETFVYGGPNGDSITASSQGATQTTSDYTSDARFMTPFGLPTPRIKSVTYGSTGDTSSSDSYSSIAGTWQYDWGFLSSPFADYSESARTETVTDPRGNISKTTFHLNDVNEIDTEETESITRQEQAPPVPIPQSKCENAPKPFDTRRPPLFVGVDNHLGVSTRLESMAELLQFITQFGEVVDLTVVHDLNRVIFIAHRLPTGIAQIHNRQAAVCQIGVRVRCRPFPECIGTAVLQCQRCLPKTVSIGASDDAENAAHGSISADHYLKWSHCPFDFAVVTAHRENNEQSPATFALGAMSLGETRDRRHPK